MANIFRLYFAKSETYYADIEANTLDEAIAKEGSINANDMHEIDGTMECILDKNILEIITKGQIWKLV